MQGRLSKKVEAMVEHWLNQHLDDSMRAELLGLLAAFPSQVEDAFGSKLTFGSAGLRAPMGVGPNRLNRYTVAMASRGLAIYLREKYPAPTVFIGYDGRAHSMQFARITAAVLAAQGVKVFLITALRPTPYVSFGCRYFRCQAGVMITASHNPKEYNGYKVFNEHGGQIVAPVDEEILRHMSTVHDFSTIELADFSSPLIEMVDMETIDQIYLEEVASLSRKQSENETRGHELSIVYTNLHGVGITLLPKMLRSWGFSTLMQVPKQAMIDSDFPSVKTPNPEDNSAMEMGVALANEVQADLLIATDPDADRIRIGTKDQGKIHLLSGNEIALLCAEFLLLHTPLEKSQFFMVKTMVTTPLIDTIANHFQIPIFNVLTGFKNIAQIIDAEYEKNPSARFLFGAEESCGFLIGDHARDKDAQVMACLLAEMALFYKNQGESFHDRLMGIYRRWGLIQDQQKSIQLEVGNLRMVATKMTKLRSHPLKEIAGFSVISAEDYLEKGADLLIFHLEGGHRIILRPSGTEPKIKAYASFCSPDQEITRQAVVACQKSAQMLADAILAMI